MPNQRPHVVPVRSRRDFLAKAGSGLGAIALGHLLNQSGFIPQGLAKEAVRNPLAPKPPHHPPKAKSVIWLFMEGGPSHVDLFDTKPMLDKLAGQPMPPSFDRPITAMGTADNTLMPSKRKWNQFGESGLWVSDWYPHTAQHVDKRQVGADGEDVPQGDIDAAHRGDNRSPPTVLGGVLVHLLPQIVDRGRILSAHQREQLVAEDRRSDRSRPAPHRRFAPSFQAVPCRESYPHRFARSDTMACVGEFGNRLSQREDIHRDDVVSHCPSIRSGVAMRLRRQRLRPTLRRHGPARVRLLPPATWTRTESSRKRRVRSSALHLARGGFR